MNKRQYKITKDSTTAWYTVWFRDYRETTSVFGNTSGKWGNWIQITSSLVLRDLESAVDKWTVIEKYHGDDEEVMVYPDFITKEGII